MVYAAPEIVAALEEREELAPTALPRGIAFPHPRKPLMWATAEPLICLGRVPAGVPFGAPDGGLTDIFVMICVNDERLHLALLARLARMFNTDLAPVLRETEDSEEALHYMIQTELAILTLE